MLHDNNTSLSRSLKTSQQITGHSTNVVIMLAHRLRRWTNIKTTFIHQLLFVEIILSDCFNLYTANHNYWKWYNLSHDVINSSQSVILLLLKVIQSVTWRDQLITVRHSVVIKSDTICHMNSSQSVILLLLKVIKSVTWRDELITVRHSVVIKSDQICHMTWSSHHSLLFCCYLNRGIIP